MPKIVVLEDDLMLLELYSDVLRHAGYDVVAKNNLYDVQHYFETETADLIFADLRLGVTTAEETIEALHVIHNKHTLSVILISAQMMIYEEQCRQAGFTYLMTKPFPNNILLQMVKAALQANAS